MLLARTLLGASNAAATMDTSGTVSAAAPKYSSCQRTVRGWSAPVPHLTSKTVRFLFLALRTPTLPHLHDDTEVILMENHSAGNQDLEAAGLSIWWKEGVKQRDDVWRSFVLLTCSLLLWNSAGLGHLITDNDRLPMPPSSTPLHPPPTCSLSQPVILKPLEPNPETLEPETSASDLVNPKSNRGLLTDQVPELGLSPQPPMPHQLR
eukprot:844576-Rhodomonas_salina.1